MIRPYRPTLGRKQNGDNASFTSAWLTIRRTVPRWWIDRLIDRSAEEARAAKRRYGHIAWGWSGGKDSIALKTVMDAAGIDESLLVITRLEWPAFLAYATEWMPDGLTVVDRSGVTMDWLRRNPSMLFPSNATIANKWQAMVQRTGWRIYYRTERLDCIVIGRRAADGNWGRRFFEDRMGRRWLCPIVDWTHEDVLAACAYYGDPLPPTYGWPRGWAGIPLISFE